jgi:hypothetical protein
MPNSAAILEVKNFEDPNVQQVIRVLRIVRRLPDYRNSTVKKMLEQRLRDSIEDE